PSFVAQFDPSAPFANQDGLVAAPNIDLASQFVQLLTAKYDFAANAKVIQAYDATTKSLLDIKVLYPNRMACSASGASAHMSDCLTRLAQAISKATNRP